MVESFPYHFPQIQPTAEAIQFAMAANVLRTFLGNEWCDVNLIGEGSPYLTPTAQDTTSRMKGQARIVALAEMIFNLQHASGAQARFEALTRVDFESAIAELEAARLLVINNVPFRFVLETGRKQQDYDIELTAQNGEVVCCETKCKMESTGFSGRSLLDSLNQAVKQLPSASPGIVFIKFPETWVQNRVLLQEMA
jgi:hypothetical protein